MTKLLSPSRTGLIQPARWTPNTQSSQWAGLRTWYPFDGHNYPLGEDLAGGRSGFNRALISTEGMGQYQSSAAAADFSSMPRFTPYTWEGTDRLFLPTPPHVEPPITISYWFAPGSGWYNNFHIFFGLMAAGSWDGYYFQLQITPTPAISAIHISNADFNGGTGNVPLPSLNIGDVYHVAFAVRSFSLTQLYVNGILSHGSNYSNGAHGAPLTHLEIGRLPVYNGAMHSPLMRDLRIYDRGLTDDEVWQLYDPATRYDLYEPVRRQRYFFAPALQQIDPSTTTLAFASPQPAIIPGEVVVSPQVTALTTAVEEPTVIFPLFLYPETVTLASAVPQPTVTVGPTTVAPQTVPLAFAPAQPVLQPGEVTVSPSLTGLSFLPQAPHIAAQAYIFAAARVLRRMLGLRRKIVRFGRYAMPNYDASINSIVSGDSLRVEAVVREVAANDYIVKAWLTIKAAETDPDISAVLQKVITTTQVAAVGQVADTGAADGVAHLEFDFLKTDTALLTPGVTYYYDIQCMTFGGGVFTLEKGSITTRRGITVSDT